MTRPVCFFGKTRHYTELRFKAKKLMLFDSLKKYFGSENKDLPTDSNMLLFLTYEDDLRGKKIYQLQNRLHKQKVKIERLKDKLTEANEVIKEKKFGSIRVCPACKGSGFAPSKGKDCLVHCFGCSGRGVVTVD